MTDRLTQRELTHHLRTAIDRAIWFPQPRWRQSVRDLMAENPRGSTSSHVTHNLGAARRAWLAQLDTKEGASLAKEDS